MGHKNYVLPYMIFVRKNFHIRDTLFNFQLPEETDHIRQRGNTRDWPALQLVKTYYLDLADRNRLLFRIAEKSGLCRGEGGR